MKQELLKWIYENKVGRPSVFGLGAVETVYMDDLIEMINELEEPQVTNEQAWNKIAESYPETAQNLRITLDHAVYGHEAEPQKVKVPAFVADYINWCKQHDWQLTAIATTSNAEYFEFHSEPSGLHEWIIENYSTFLIAIATDDYDVEEEPKWAVIGKQGYLTSLKIENGEARGWTGNSDKFNSGAIHFEDKEKAEAVALLVSGEVKKV